MDISKTVLSESGTKYDIVFMIDDNTKSIGVYIDTKYWGVIKDMPPHKYPSLTFSLFRKNPIRLVKDLVYIYESEEIERSNEKRVFDDFLNWDGKC